MGGGSSTPAPVNMSELEDPKHKRPFHIELTFECGDFPKAEDAPEDQGTTCTVVVRLNGDTAPYAADNFRRLCEKPVSEGGYIGSTLSDVTPGVGIMGGVIGGKNASSFGGKPFTNEDEEDSDHVKWALTMVSNTKLKVPGRTLEEGCFGSEFLVYSGDDGDTQAAMMDADDSFYPIGKVVQGFEMVGLLETLIESEDWKWINNKKNKSGNFAICADSVGGEPAVPVTLTKATELQNYLPPTSKKDKHGRRRGRKRRQSNDSITSREKDDGRGKNFASVIDTGPDINPESKEGNASVIESCQF